MEVRQFSVAIIAAFSVACASAGSRPIDLSKLPPIVIQAPGNGPASVPNSPAPVRPRATLAFQVVDEDTGAPIATAFVTFEDATTRQVNADGYVAFERDASAAPDKPAIYKVTFEADDYQSVTRRFQLDENRQFAVRLKSTKKPDPVPPQAAPPIAPPPVMPPPAQPPSPGPAGVIECSAPDNTMRISHACLAAVASTSAHYGVCNRTGDQHACHYYVREVAIALRTAQGDPRWGLIRKTQGGANVEGYGEDVVAYLPAPLSIEAPTWQWRGADIVGGAGAPGARFVAGELNQALPCPQPSGWCNRTSDIWAPVPAPSSRQARFRWPQLTPSALLSRTAEVRWSAPKTSAPFPRWKTRLGLAFAMTCHGADLGITQFMLGRYPDRFQEANPVLAWIEDPVWFGIAKMGLASGSSWLLVAAAEDHPRRAFWGSIAVGASTCYVAHRNASLAGLR